MWERWKKRLSNIFLSEEANNELKDRSLQTFKTKVTYQYPNHSKFRFPVIPDHDLHKPAYQRVREKQNYSRGQKEVREVRERTSETEHVKEPFKPTQVASPIY